MRNAQLSPDGTAVSFVYDNDLYVRRIGFQHDPVQRLTSEFSDDILSGINSWVYEEEIFGSSDATRWSPSSERLAFLQFNQTQTPLRSIPHFQRGFDVSSDASTRPGHVRDRYEAEKVGANAWFERYPRTNDTNPRWKLLVAAHVDVANRTIPAHILNRVFPVQCNALHYITQFEWLNSTTLLIVSTTRQYDRQLLQVSSAPMFDTCTVVRHRSIIHNEPFIDPDLAQMLIVNSGKRALSLEPQNTPQNQYPIVRVTDLQDLSSVEINEIAKLSIIKFVCLSVFIYIFEKFLNFIFFS